MKSSTLLGKKYEISIKQEENFTYCTILDDNKTKIALIKFNDNLLQGYIDAWYQDDENDIHIIDWKSSTIYTGNTLKEKSGQLVCYAMSFMNKGIPLSKIHLHFNFLKYCTITYEQANGKIKEMNVERRLLGEKLQTPCKMWLKKFGYDVDEYLPKILDTMDIKCLPQEVQDKFQIKDCYVEVPLDKDIIKYWNDYVVDTINNIEGAIMNYEIFDDDSMFQDSIDEVAAQSFYYATLSEYTYLNATVVNRNIGYWYNTITIDKGKYNGVEVDMVVVNNDGLIGKVVSTTTFTSDIKLLTTSDDGE